MSALDNMKPVRVAVIDDSLTVRERIAQILEEDPRFEVVARGRDGKDAIDIVERLRPQVVVMDLMMRGMDGIAATEWIMGNRPTPILICSAASNRRGLLETYDALARGAVDVIEKPTDAEGSARFPEALRAAVMTVSTIRVITHISGRLRTLRGKLKASSGAHAVRGSAGTPKVLAVAASTGGPSAIARLLSSLGADFPLPILVLLHIDSVFGRGFAEWLGGLAPQPTRFHEDGEPLYSSAGCVLVAPPGTHSVVRDGTLCFDDSPERHGCKPSADVLFESLAVEVGPGAIGCLLTGMGRDGAAGLLALRRAGARTLAQDQTSSLIFGMPAAAIELGAAEKVVALDAMGSKIRSLLGQRDGGE